MSKPKNSFFAVNPLASKHSSGMSVAGEFVSNVFGDAASSAKVNSIYEFINDVQFPSVIRGIARILVSNLLPLFYRRLIFTSHHAPFWSSGYHGMILHDVICLRYPRQYPMQTQYFKLCLRPLVNSCQLLVQISNSGCQDLKRYLGDSVSYRTTVIPSMHQQFVPAKVAKKWPERVRSGTLLFVGGKYKHKNLDCVLEALLILKEKYNLSLRLIACGVDSTLWWQKHGGLSRYPLKHKVAFSSYTSKEELSRAYENASALIFPSFYEGMGLPPLEAMAFGCPVIANDIPVLRETCGEGAHYFDGESAISLSDLIIGLFSEEKDELVERKVEAGYARVEKFSNTVLRKKWANLLSILNESIDRDSSSFV